MLPGAKLCRALVPMGFKMTEKSQVAFEGRFAWADGWHRRSVDERHRAWLSA